MSSVRARFTVLACLFGLALFMAPKSLPAAAQGSSGVAELRGATVSWNAHHDTSPPLRSIAPSHTQSHTYPAKATPQRGLTSGKASVQGRTHAASPQTALAIPSTSNNIEGVGQGFSGPQGTFSVSSAPPDTIGAVGPSNYVQVVNTDFAVFNKSGTVLYGPVQTNTLWSGFGGLCQSDNDGDGTVVYDRAANRWVISQFAITGATTTFLQCVAVSQTGDPTGSYYRYSFSYSSFPDYPKLGVWPDAYYTTFNLFDSTGTTFQGGLIAAYNRSAMLTGAAATQQTFNVGTSFGGLLPANVDSSSLPASGTPEWIVSLGSAANQLAYWKFHVDWTTPANSTLTGPSTLATQAFSQLCGGGTCVPQAGTTQQLDSLADRLMYRLAYRNFGDHESLVVNHSVVAGSGGGVQWYELRPSSGALSIYQQGVYAPDSSYRWMGSIAMDGSGDVGLGFSLSSSSINPQIHYTGRLSGDALGTMPQGEGTIINGTGSQSGQNLSRWGDYSGMTVDPSDDCTFWYTTEYLTATGAFNWHTRIGSFKFSTCGSTQTNDFSISVSPSSQTVTQGQSTTYTVSTAVTSGSAGSVSLSIGGLPSGASGSFSPNPVTAGNSSTLTVSTASTTPAGTSTLTITGTEGSATHSATTSLVVNSSGGGGSIVTNGGFETGSLSGWSTGGVKTPVVSTAQKHSGSYSALLGSTTTPEPNGDSSIQQTIAVPSSGGTLRFWYWPSTTDTITYDWQEAQVRNTSGATLAQVFKVASNAQAWTQVTFDLSPYAGTSVVLWFNDHEDGFGDLTYYYLDDVSVTANVVSNGGFETGSLASWTTGGVKTPVVSTAQKHSGSYSALLGSTTTPEPNGDSSIQQTIIVPAGGATLSFWYRPSTTDTITYDWQEAQIRNTSGATLAQVFKVASNSGTWTQVTYSLSAYAGQTIVLWFNDHEDGFGDLTYMYLDDVSAS
jgi:hypothetical protein